MIFDGADGREDDQPSNAAALQLTFGWMDESVRRNVQRAAPWTESDVTPRHRSMTSLTLEAGRR